MTAEIIDFPVRCNTPPEPVPAGFIGRNSLAFGPFRLWPAERRLEKSGIFVPLGGRALDILMVLIERPGEVVSKQELMRRVWPGIAVEESNLRVNIASLRKALGDCIAAARFIGSVAGRGYCFVAPVSGGLGLPAADDADTASALTIPAGRIAGLGAEQILQAIAAQLGGRQFVHIVMTNEEILRLAGEQVAREGPTLVSWLRPI
jgi:DNA-binding winged helix-turn-helix (wHTH) protein